MVKEIGEDVWHVSAAKRFCGETQSHAGVRQMLQIISLLFEEKKSFYFQPTGGATHLTYDAAANKDGAKFPGDKMGGGSAGREASQTRRGIQTFPDGQCHRVERCSRVRVWGRVGQSVSQGGGV